MSLDKAILEGIVKDPTKNFTATNLVTNGNHLTQARDFLFEIEGADLPVNLLQLCALHGRSEAVKNLAEAEIDGAKAFDIYEGDQDAGFLPFQLAVKSNSTEAANFLLTKMQAIKGAEALKDVKLDLNSLDATHISKVIAKIYELGINMSVTVFPDGDVAGPLHLLAANEALTNGVTKQTFTKAKEKGEIDKTTSVFDATPLETAANQLNFPAIVQLLDVGADAHHATSLDGWNALCFALNAKGDGAKQFNCLDALIRQSDKHMWEQKAKAYGPGNQWGGHLFPNDPQGTTTEHTALEFAQAFISQHPGEGYESLIDFVSNQVGIPLAGADAAGIDSLYT